MNVIIVGAGIGGLTLGNLLSQSDQDIQFQIFERDADAHSRSQGYSITLREPGGLIPLRQLGLYDEMRNVSSVVANFPFLTQTGKPLMNLRDNLASPRTLRVFREKLRDVLLHGIEQNVHFDGPCLGFTEREGKPTVRLAGGREVSADLVVACDGVNSVIRQQMIGDTPSYLGISAISGAVVPALNHPLLADESFMMVGDGIGLFVVNENDTTVWSLSMQARIDEFEGVSKPILKERSMDATKDWCAPIPEIISQTDPENITVRRYYDKEPLTDAHHGQIVLLGDAAHPMTPFRGEGANMSMVDAHSLANLLIASDRNRIDEIIDSYQKEMLNRTRKAVLDSRKAALEIHTTNPLSQVARNTKWRMANRMLSWVQMGQSRSARQQ
ncbi:MAG: NAD(P)/FAD-dependent oxidoreductase [Chloroflexota bacterium]